MAKAVGITGSPADIEAVSGHLNDAIVAFSAVSSFSKDSSAASGQVQGVNGCFVPSTLSALLGTKNSGKSNLLRLLGGVTDGRPAASGSIVIAGMDPLTTRQQHITAFVDDFDALIPNLTVEAQLQYAADFAYARTALSRAQKRACIDDTLCLLGLETVRSCRIGDAWRPGISDVEKKLVSIAVGMMGLPDVLLVDSPTYRLEHADGSRVMRALKAVAQRGPTVILALDGPTPTAYALLDRVLVLQQGRTVYYGQTGAALADHFEVHCMHVPTLSSSQLPESEWLMEVLEQADQPSNAQSGGSLADAFEAAPAHKAAVKEAGGYTQPAAKSTLRPSGSFSSGAVARRAGTPAWLSLPLLLKHRTLRNIVDPAWILIRALDKLLFSILIMSVYYHRGSFVDPASFGNIISILWMFAILPLFSATQYLPLVALEMPMYLRERRRGWYGATAYLVHKMVEEVGLTVLMTAPFDAILFYPMQLHGQFVYFWMVHLVSSTIGILVVYLAAVVTPSIELASSVVPVLLIALLFFGGALIRTLDLPRGWKWFSYLTPLRYSFGGLMMNEYGRLGFEPLLVTYDLLGRNKWHYLGCEAVFVAGLLALLWVALACKRRAPQYSTSIRPRRS